ncbi:MAG: hypothetical protein WAV32_01335 [Halobacteriota archaeon]
MAIASSADLDRIFTLSDHPIKGDIKTLYQSINELNLDGKILVLSDMDVEEDEIYELHKKRETIEKMFDTYKTVLNADKIYLQDEESVFGHVFYSYHFYLSTFTVNWSSS